MPHWRRGDTPSLGCGGGFLWQMTSELSVEGGLGVNQQQKIRKSGFRSKANSTARMGTRCSWFLEGKKITRFEREDSCGSREM